MKERVVQNRGDLFENLTRRLDLPFLSNICFQCREIAHKFGLDKIAESKNFIYSQADFNDIIEFYNWFNREIKSYPYLFEINPTLKDFNNQQNAILKHMYKVDSQVITIRSKKNLKILGCVQLLSLDDDDYKPELYVDSDYILTIYLSPEALNSRSSTGIGTEAIKTLLTSIFANSEKRRVMLRVDYRNIAAIKCYLRCGFLPYTKNPNIRSWSQIIKLCQNKNTKIFPKGLITMFVNKKMVQSNEGDYYKTATDRGKTQYELYFRALQENTQQNP